MIYTSLDETGLAKETGLLTVHSYDPNTGEFTGSSEEYVSVGVGIPANSTCTAPPDAEQGKAMIFNGGWQLVEDHRGETVYSTENGTATVISQAGEYPTGTTLLKPATAFDTWNGKKWVTDKAAQQAALVKIADAEKARLIAVANSTTQAWQTQLMLGIITDADKAALTEWMTYIQALQALDTSSAPDITWPAAPDAEAV
ncbi:tail assembly protein [Pantoea rodasii]|uniref:Tail assembly protein n=2 Tax=Pantoea TaxID=53335 RepID=A0A0U3K4K6_9GAMM|nr:tail assembly protein [Pantoea vagans]KHJ66074.1 tail assembly protein [Pantoea rodasii]